MDQISAVSGQAPSASHGWRIRRIAFAVLVAASLIAIYYSTRQRGGEDAKASQKPPVMVSAAAVERGDIPVTLNALGTVTSQYTVAVKTHIAGYLTRVAYTEGQIVRTGEPLAQIDPRPYELARAQAGGQLRKDRALLQSALLDVQRYRTLYDQDSVAKQQLDDQEALVEQYRGTVELDQAQLDTANLNLTYCRIVAPIAGRVGLRLADPGSYVQPTDTNGLVVITQLQPITVVFTLPEDTLGPVMSRLRGGAKLPVVITDRNAVATLAEGTLTTIDNQIDTTTGTVKLRAQFTNEDGRLFPNQFVNVRLFVNQLSGTTLVPSAAIRHGAPGDFVYLIKADNTAVVRPIRTGPSFDERVSVEDGLHPGDRVVVDGIDKLRDGAHVAFAGERGRKVTASR